MTVTASHVHLISDDNDAQLCNLCHQSNKLIYNYSYVDPDMLEDEDVTVKTPPRPSAPPAVENGRSDSVKSKKVGNGQLTDAVTPVAANGINSSNAFDHDHEQTKF